MFQQTKLNKTHAYEYIFILRFVWHASFHLLIVVKRPTEPKQHLTKIFTNLYAVISKIENSYYKTGII